MRMGASLARGSCRALTWLAVFGVVFALGAGQAAAQWTPDEPHFTIDFHPESTIWPYIPKTLYEGERVAIEVIVHAKNDVPRGTRAYVRISARARGSAGGTTAEPEDYRFIPDPDDPDRQPIGEGYGVFNSLREAKVAITMEAIADVDRDDESVALSIRAGYYNTSNEFVRVPDGPGSANLDHTINIRDREPGRPFSIVDIGDGVPSSVREGEDAEITVTLSKEVAGYAPAEWAEVQVDIQRSSDTSASRSLPHRRYLRNTHESGDVSFNHPMQERDGLTAIERVRVPGNTGPTVVEETVEVTFVLQTGGDRDAEDEGVWLNFHASLDNSPDSPWKKSANSGRSGR